MKNHSDVMYAQKRNKTDRDIRDVIIHHQPPDHKKSGLEVLEDEKREYIDGMLGGNLDHAKIKRIIDKRAEENPPPNFGPPPRFTRRRPIV